MVKTMGATAGVHGGDVDHLQVFLVDHSGVVVSEDDQLASARADFLDVGFQLVQ